MENLAVSSQLSAHGAKVRNVETTNLGLSSDTAEKMPAAAKFGALLAMQIALAAPQDPAAVEAVLKGATKETEAKGDDAQDAASVLGMLPQALVDSALIPLQKALPVVSSAPATSASGASEALANVKAASGKELPVGNAGSVDVTTTVNSRDLPKTSDMPDLAEPGQLRFGALLAEKKADLVSQDAALAQNGSAPAQQLQASLLTADKVPATNQPGLSVPQRVGAESWGTGLGDKVVWMVGNQTRGAEIHLNPPALGPLEVRVNIADGQANLSFMTHHVSVREAIEAATPKLREMLGDTGIGMGSVSVNVGSFAQQQQAPSQQQEQGRASWHSAVADAAFSGETLTTFVQPLRGRGMVDFFA